MMEFRYEGLAEGRRVRGVVEAASRAEAVKKLKSEGVKPLKVEPVKRRLFSFRRGPSEEELAFALVQLATLLSAGLPLPKALELAARQVESKELSSAFLTVKKALERGEPLPEAFRKAGVFPEYLTHMLSAVQRGENLEFILRTAGEYLRKVAAFKARVLNALIYPTVVILFSFVSLLVTVTVVVPKVAGVLESLGRELPLATRAVLLLSKLLSSALPLLPMAVAAFLWRERLLGPERAGALLLKLPVYGKVSFYFNLARFARTLAMLLRAAVPLPQAVLLASKSVTNAFIRKKLEQLVPELERGKSLSELLKRTSVFPETFVNLVETGEASGELERMLELLADTYEELAERVVEFWLRVAEPLAILVIGLVVGLVVVSVLLPLTEVSAGLG
ncbi:MAG: type II secretion system F family protein [Aquificae bacterium]|nr:type II secretion system F family protein [Aquificota bacterium]